jgi:hypothetical protein
MGSAESRVTKARVIRELLLAHRTPQLASAPAWSAATSHCKNILTPDRYFHQFRVIHAAPDHLWKELVERMVDELRSICQIGPRGPT